MGRAAGWFVYVAMSRCTLALVFPARLAAVGLVLEMNVKIDALQGRCRCIVMGLRVRDKSACRCRCAHVVVDVCLYHARYV